MEDFVNNITIDEPYPNILLYQSEHKIGERINELAVKGRLNNVYIMGLFGRKYNNQLIEKLGIKGYINMINTITLLEGGKIFTDFIVKKSWCSQINRVKILNLQDNKL